MQLSSDEAAVGILAGWGRYPIVVAEALKRQARTVHCLGIQGHASPELAEICDEFRYIGIAKLGAQIRYFRQRRVHQVTMAGKLFKAPLMYHRWGWFHFLPDWRCLRTFYPHFITKTKDRKDDTLLKAVIDEFEKDGIVFAPATEFVPEVLVRPGHLAGPELSTAQHRDIAFGWQIAKEIGRLDVGQSVCVKGQSPLAIEAVEGTDACIQRAGDLCPQGGFTVVKVAKPQQDMRFDVPTIGVGTLETMAQAGGNVLAIEAGKTIILDEPAVIEFARRHRISILSVVEPQLLRAAG